MESRIKSDVRGWLNTLAFAIIGAVAGMIAIVTAVLNFLH